MAYYDERLWKLQQDMARKKQLDTILENLYERERHLRSRTEELKEIMDREQTDVDRLEGRSLASFFYQVIGRQDEQLTKEREEAYAARVKYDAAAGELAELAHCISSRESEIASLKQCQQEYEELLKEKSEEIKGRGGFHAQQILEQEHQLADLESRKKELNEAAGAGHTALGMAENILSGLDNADGWATWDLIGGGLLTDLVKHDQLDRAQRQVEELQVQLRRFRCELADVDMQADLKVDVDGFLRFADYFFDNLFTDWVVKDRISQSRNQVRTVRNELVTALSRLDAMDRSNESELIRVRTRLEILVKNFKMDGEA